MIHHNSSGLDSISSSLLRNCVDVIYITLLTSFTQRKLPDIWLTATIITIFNSEDKLNPNLYRPLNSAPTCEEKKGIFIDTLFIIIFTSNVIPLI